MSLFLLLLKRMSILQWAIVVVVMLFAGMSIKYKIEHALRLQAQANERTAQIFALNEHARFEETQKITMDSIKVLGDAVNLYRRQVIQEKQRVSELDHKLGQYAVANYNLKLSIDTLRRRLEAPVTDSGDSLRATFKVDQPPYHGTADVALPKTITNDAKGRLDLLIAQDPLLLTATVACGKEERNGVRPAYLNILSPKYVEVRLDSVSQSEEVCSPKPEVVTKSGKSFFGKVWGGIKVGAVAAGAFFVGRGTK